MLAINPDIGWADTPTATIVNIATDSTDPQNLADTEPSIAVNPLNPQHIAVVSFFEPWDQNDPAVMAPVWKSDDGGMTWRKVRQIPRPSPGLRGPGDQKIAFNSEGRLFIAELGLGGAIQDFIYRQTSNNPDDPLTPGAAYGDDQPHLEVDNGPGSPRRGQIYSPWLMTNADKAHSIVSISSDGGVNVTDVPAGDNTSFPNRSTRIALAPDGSAYVIYKTREGTASGDFENAHFWVIRSVDGGKTWMPKTCVHGVAPVQTFFTNNFGNPSKGKVGRARSSDGWIAADPGTGYVYAAYVSKDASGFGQIYVSRTSDQGANWSSSRVTDGTHHSAYPEIAVAANGAVGVLYIDYDDSGAKTIFRHRFARSFDHAGGWHDQILQSMDPEPLSNAASGFLWGDYEGLTACGNTFFGVFTGQSIGRSTAQLDPIFFKETAVSDDQARSIARILTNKAIWGKDLPAALARVRGWGEAQQSRIEIFPDRIVGASPLRDSQGQEPVKKLTGALKAAAPDLTAAFASWQTDTSAEAGARFKVSVLNHVDDRSPRLGITDENLQFLKPGLTLATVQSQIGGPARVSQLVIQDDKGDHRPVILKLYHYGEGALAFAVSELEAKPGLINRVILDVPKVEAAMLKIPQR
jgi:hypothetical protein